MAHSTSRKEAIEQATGAAWSEWVGMLDAVGGRSLRQSERVDWVAATLQVPEDTRLYWARSIAILYRKTLET